MNTVKDMLDIKGRGVWSIGATQTVYQAIEKMQDKSVGALPVLDDDARLEGIVSERDYTHKVILRNKSSRGSIAALSSKSRTFWPRRISNWALR